MDDISERAAARDIVIGDDPSRFKERLAKLVKPTAAPEKPE